MAPKPVKPAARPAPIPPTTRRVVLFTEFPIQEALFLNLEVTDKERSTK
jgi:hypothetical protein